MSKARILINMHYMALGGAERALLGLLEALDPERVDVDLFLNQHTGEFMPLIPGKVNLLPEQRGYNAIERPMKDILREGQLGVLAGRLKAKWQHRRYLSTLTPEQRAYDCSAFQYVADCVSPFLPAIQGAASEYDLAISFLHPHNIVLDKVRARKKIAWIHTDYSTIHINVEKELKVWEQYDHIASISDDCTRSFPEKFPSLADKIVLIENILSPSIIREQASSPPLKREESNDGMQLLSVGRICQAKNYDNIPYIAQTLKAEGLQFTWHIVGPGDHAAIDQKLAETDTADCVKFLGPKSNPYPYIRACDIYLQPSRYEGKSVTVREAQILCKPVIITNYTTAASQVQDGVDGIICPMDNASIARAIVDLAHDPAQRQQLSHYLATHDYGNEAEVNKLYQLLEKH